MQLFLIVNLNVFRARIAFPEILKAPNTLPRYFLKFYKSISLLASLCYKKGSILFIVINNWQSGFLKSPSAGLNSFDDKL